MNTETPGQALRRVAAELEGYEAQPETFKGVRRDPVEVARVTIRMAVELLRERASDLDGLPPDAVIHPNYDVNNGGAEIPYQEWVRQRRDDPIDEGKNDVYAGD